MRAFGVFLAFTLAASPVFAEIRDAVSAPPPAGLVKEWAFSPGYALPGNAAIATPHPANPPQSQGVFAITPDRIEFLGLKETDRRRNLLNGEETPRKTFSVELWALLHVNHPVGALAAAFSNTEKHEADWGLGFSGDAILFGDLSDARARVAVNMADMKLEKYKERWVHLVGVHDGRSMTLYFNGREVGRKNAAGARRAPAEKAAFDILAFTESEPYMKLENLVQAAGVYDRALTNAEIESLFARRARLVDEGVLYEDSFHFTAGPYLNLPGANSMNLVVETDRPSRMEVRWGENAPLSETLRSNELQRLHAFALTGLKPGSPYFYEVVAQDDEGQELRSGLLTFKTAVEKNQPFTVAVLGDTEARPFINDAVIKSLWPARPDFALILGDLTDGGVAERRFEWTHEFFVGMTQFGSRVPIVAAPGNGEDDLVWFRRYHHFPGEENFFAFTYGDAQFFVLDSNLSYREQEEPGFRERQKAWLRGALKNSKARWKIALHHHPVYSSDENDYGDSWSKGGRGIGDEDVRNDFLRIYEEFGVDIVLQAHMHIYERSHPLRDGAVDMKNGVIYITAGGAGGNLEDFTPARDWYAHKTYRGHHYALISVNGDVIEYEARDTEGRLRDHMTMVKTPDGGRALLPFAPRK